MQEQVEQERRTLVRFQGRSETREHLGEVHADRVGVVRVPIGFTVKQKLMIQQTPWNVFFKPLSPYYITLCLQSEHHFSLKLPCSKLPRAKIVSILHSCKLFSHISYHIIILLLIIIYHSGIHIYCSPVKESISVWMRQGWGRSCNGGGLVSSAGFIVEAVINENKKKK